MTLSVEQEKDVLAALQQAVGTPLGNAMRQLVQREFERAKGRLVEALPADIAGLQGEARAYKRMLKYLIGHSSSQV